MDEKFTRRFESFKNSLDSLAELITGDVWMDMLKSVISWHMTMME